MYIPDFQIFLYIACPCFWLLISIPFPSDVAVECSTFVGNLLTSIPFSLSFVTFCFCSHGVDFCNLRSFLSLYNLESPSNFLSRDISTSSIFLVGYLLNLHSPAFPSIPVQEHWDNSRFIHFYLRGCWNSSHNCLLFRPISYLSILRSQLGLTYFLSTQNW